MKLDKKIIAGAIGLVLVAAITIPVKFSAKPQPAAPTPGPAVMATPANPPERHPEIREALEALRRAKGHMEHAAHDFGGHREEAIRATNEAIRQLEICLRYDRN